MINFIYLRRMLKSKSMGNIEVNTHVFSFAFGIMPVVSAMESYREKIFQLVGVSWDNAAGATWRFFIGTRFSQPYVGRFGWNFAQWFFNQLPKSVLKDFWKFEKLSAKFKFWFLTKFLSNIYFWLKMVNLHAFNQYRTLLSIKVNLRKKYLRIFEKI